MTKDRSLSTSEVLDQIEGRAHGATRGPWDEWAAIDQDGARINGISATHWRTADVCTMGTTPQDSENSCFIANARTDIPALTSALRAVLRVLELHEQANPMGREQWNADIRADIDTALKTVDTSLSDF